MIQSKRLFQVSPANVFLFKSASDLQAFPQTNKLPSTS